MTIVRAGERRRGGSARGGHRVEVLTAPLPGQRAELSRHVLAPGARDRPGRRPADARARQPRDRPRRGRRRRPGGRRRAPRAGRGRLRRPSTPTCPTTSPTPAPTRRACWPSSPRASDGAEPMAPHDAVRQDLGRPRGGARPAVHRPAPRPRGHEPAGLRRAAPGRAAGPPPRPHAGHRRPQRARPTARRSPRASATRSPRTQVETLERNCAEFGIPLYSLGSEHQGIVHVIGPELGLTQPGMTIVCGDSHTATHGAFGALAFGIGTSEVEHVLATQTPRAAQAALDARPLRGRASASASRPRTSSSATIGQMGVDGAAGHVVEFAGPGVEALSMEGRMTVCNMTIEGGGRAGMIAPDDDDVRLGGRARRRGRPGLVGPAHRRRRDVRQGGRRRRRRAEPDGELGDEPGAGRRRHRRRARALAARARSARWPTWTCGRARRSQDIRLDRVFIGSCTNSRIGDLRAAAAVVEGHRVASHVDAMVVPGSVQVKRQAEAEGLDEVFRAAGFDWRGAGCSMCLGMNPDIAAPGERVASHLEPQLRGAPGPRRPHATSSARRWPPRPPSRATSSTSASGARSHRMRAIETITGPVAVLTRDDVDTDQIIPKQFLKRVERTGFGEFLFYDWAKEPGWDLPANQILVTGRELRLRLEPRARAVGARGLRLPRDHRAEASRTSSARTARRSACCRSSLAPRTRAGGRRRPARAGRPRRPGGPLDRRRRRARRALRDRPRGQAPAAQRPRRHRADAPAATTRSPPTSATASARGPRHDGARP